MAAGFALLALLAAPIAARAAQQADEDVVPAPTRPVAQEPARGDARVVADSATLVYSAQADAGSRTLSDFGDEPARLTWVINRKKGTWTSYQLATREDLPMPFFEPGFTFTLPPPRRTEPKLRLEPIYWPAPKRETGPID